MSFKKVYSCLLNKLERKGSGEEDLRAIISWLTGYSNEEINSSLLSDISYGDFFRLSPSLNPKRNEISGTICGVKLCDIKDPLMKDIRVLDKLVDERAKGKELDIILR